MTEIRRVFVIAANTRDFHDYCCMANLVPGHTAIWVGSVMALRGLSSPIEIVFTDRAPARSDYYELRDQVRRITNEPVPAVPVLSKIEEGMALMVGGTPLVVTDVSTDGEGCLQVVLSRRESYCHRLFGQRKDAPKGQSSEFSQPENMRIEDAPHRSDHKGLYRSVPKTCKCGFRAPELGPHPDCPIHGHDSPDPGPHNEVTGSGRTDHPQGG